MKKKRIIITAQGEEPHVRHFTREVNTFLKNYHKNFPSAQVATSQDVQDVAPKPADEVLAGFLSLDRATLIRNKKNTETGRIAIPEGKEPRITELPRTVMQLGVTPIGNILAEAIGALDMTADGRKGLGLVVVVTGDTYTDLENTLSWIQMQVAKEYQCGRDENESADYFFKLTGNEK